PTTLAVVEAASSRDSSTRRGGQVGLDGKRELEWESEWIRRSHNADLKWWGEVRAILQSFTDRTPGSFLELKDSGLTWHFQNTDPDFG
ncbi:unnamed protein product, partial [Discosporangium mesarthrocarpum]